jgi:hypothetical protein
MRLILRRPTNGILLTLRGRLPEHTTALSAERFGGRSTIFKDRDRKITAKQSMDALPK